MRKNKLQSSSEVVLRNSVVGVMSIFYIVFLIVPIIIALVGSFHQWNPLNGIFNFIGLENYTEVFKSKLFWTSMWNTVIFSAIVIIFRVGLGLAIACAIHSKLVKYKSFFRTVFYMPVVTSLVAVAFVWKLMYNPQIGIINNFFGLDINWLFDTKYALPAIIVMTIWKDFGYAVVMFMAGLYSLPEDCFEAAKVDGASSWQTFKNVTLPLLKPMTLFVVVTSIISYIQTYVPVMVMTEGGPGTSTFLASYIIYDEAFVKYNFGYASAISFVLFVVTAIFTVISFKVSNSSAGSK
ncbi:carbohydrate ABC transporter permease [uncultured Clostridium sp.]|uniref:carbohydrate ABC transporter permease n=1 Tax=uncultured Clostridium sp. TaxID=59620 RepID=UPI002598B492|nr:sugar ABC transporter permease [uncultured Clostridium sp.]